MKRTLFFFLTLSMVLKGQAQLTFSLNGGVNLHCQDHIQDATEESWNLYFDDIGSPNSVKSIKKVSFILGVNAGVSVNIPVAAGWNFRTGLDFNIKGGKAEGKYGTTSTESPFSGATTYTYINVPLSMQYWLNDKFYLEAGPDIGYMMSAKYKEDDNGTGYTEKEMSYYKRVEFSIAGGGGYLLGKSGFGVFGRFIQGLSKVDISEDYYSNVRNSTGQLGFFYKLGKTPKKKS